MEALGSLIMLLGVLVVIVGNVWFLGEAFRTSILWGLGCIFVPFVSLIWLVGNWDRGRAPFLTGLAGGAVMFFGILIGGGGA